ncbi:MAG: hypothetical protein OEY07_07360 [Gammaproteobacteria bacterium]|nr:hypothetical protein [Gammaproteobacteria bacterium]
MQVKYRSGFIFSLFICLLCATQSRAAAVQELLQCESDTCLAELMLGRNPLPVTDKQCNKLDGKMSKGFVPADLGQVCHVYVARQKAATRPVQPCHYDGKKNPDYNIALSAAPLWFYANAIYQQTPLELRADKDLYRDLKGGATPFNTLVKPFSVSTSRGSGKARRQLRYDFRVYFCQAGGFLEPRYYTPYYFSIDKSDKAEGAAQWRSLGQQQGYIEQPPLQDVPVLKHLPAAFKADYVWFDLVDVDQDGRLDIVYVIKQGFEGYRPGVCLYVQGEIDCRVINAANLLKTELIRPDISVVRQTDGALQVVIYRQDKPELPREVYGFRLQDDTLAQDK